jgi:BirA family biotin operon repressor/biotin-[acetyl-CoA-carboxylase] ligase
LKPQFIALAVDRIETHLRGRERLQLEVHPSLDSTSSTLRRRADRGDIEGVVVAAETQTAGRGRQGRVWVDRSGGSLLFSLGWRPPGPSPRLAGLSLAAGIAVCQALEALGTGGVRLKWPNDLLHHHCKLGGILVETVPSPTGLAVVLGIGLNVALDPAVREQIAAPVTDLAAAGWTGDRNQLLAEVLVALRRMLVQFADAGFQPFRAEWLARHALQQRNVTIWREGQEIAAGRAIDVDEDGALLIQTPAGIRRLLSGELTLRPG